MRVTIVFVALAAGGCLRTTQFQCANDSACGAQGVCESTGFCSFVDSDCESGRRYGDSAGTMAGQCTTGGTGSDGGTIDTPITPIDGMPDSTTSVGCPSGYNLVAGAGTHLYKIVTTTDPWDTQQAACRATTLSANLFVPDDAAELMALDAVAGVASYWIGVSDTQTEGTWLALPNNTAQTYLPWATGQPESGNPTEDCVAVNSATHQFSDERCGNTNLPAICECVP
jgi:hypothetical protein